MNLMTFYLLGAAICIAGGFLSLLSFRYPMASGKHWFVYALGCIFIGVAAIRTLHTNTTVTIRLWNLLPDVPVQLSVDPLSAFFLLVLSLAAVPVCIFAYSYYRPKTGLHVHSALFPLFLVSILGVLSAENSWTFLILWEMMSLFSFGLVVDGHEESHVRRAGFVYLAMTHLGTVFLTIAFLLMNSWTGSFHFADWAADGIRLAVWQKNLVFGLALIGFGTKAGIVPFHIWLPRAHPAAPAPVSSLMSAVMVKAGLYGLLRVIWDWFGGGPLWWGALLLALGLVTALVGALYLVNKDDLKQLLAYSTVENVGILLMALGVAGISAAAGEHGLALLAFAAFLLHTLNHAVFKALLFLVSGSVQHGAGTVRLNSLGGLAKRMPYTAVVFFIGAAALAAVPLLNGFIGEWLLYQSFLGGTLHWPGAWKGFGAAAVAGLGMVGALAAAGMVKAFGTAFLAKPRTEQAAKAHEAPPSMRIGMLVLALVAIAGGLFPATLWSWVNPAIRGWVPLSLPAALPVLQDQMLQPLPKPSDAAGPIVSMPYTMWIAAAAAVLLLLFIRSMYGRSRWVRAEPWGCGHTLTERMEYSATSLTHPIMMFFRGFYRPKLMKETGSLQHARMIRLDFSIKHLIETYLYQPVVRISIKLSRKFREIQNGRIQLYLAYILITLLVLLFIQIL